MTVLHDLACSCSDCNPLFVTISKNDFENTELSKQLLKDGGINPDEIFTASILGNKVYCKQVAQH